MNLDLKDYNIDVKKSMDRSKDSGSGKRHTIDNEDVL